MSFRLRKHSPAAAAAELPSAAVLSNESQKLYAEIRAGYRASFQPADQVEADLVDRIVACQWRLLRTVAMETAAINLAMSKGAERFADTYGQLDPVTRAALAIHSIECSSASLTQLQRAESLLSKRYRETLLQLLSLQAKRSRQARNKKVEPPSSPELS